MSGNKCLFDTNALIQFFGGHPNLQKFTNQTVCLSVISVIEFLSFKNLNEKDKRLLSDFITEVEIVDLNNNNAALLNIITQLRSSYKIKLPDAIIAGTAIYKQATLITNDRGLFKVPELNILNY